MAPIRSLLNGSDGVGPIVRYAFSIISAIKRHLRFNSNAAVELESLPSSGHGDGGLQFSIRFRH